MSNAKVRARRRRRANRAWTRAMSPEVYSVVSCDYAALERSALTNAERQAEGAAVSMRELSKLIAERYPGMLQIHDGFMVAALDATQVADSVKARMTDVLRAWHKGAGFGMKVDADFFNSPKNGFGDPVNWDDMSD